MQGVLFAVLSADPHLGLAQGELVSLAPWRADPLCTLGPNPRPLATNYGYLADLINQGVIVAVTDTEASAFLTRPTPPPPPLRLVA